MQHRRLLIRAIFLTGICITAVLLGKDSQGADWTVWAFYLASLALLCGLDLAV